jgi:flagellar biogenesis protein FliO
MVSALKNMETQRMTPQKKVSELRKNERKPVRKQGFSLSITLSLILLFFVFVSCLVGRLQTCRRCEHVASI